MNLLYFLEHEWKIKTNKITTRCLKKYSERTLWLKDWISWDDIKTIQKQKLLEEHNKKDNA
jgi:hypothetical protein